MGAPGRQAGPRARRSRLVGLAARVGLLLVSAEVASCAALAIVGPRLAEPIQRKSQIFADQSEKIRILLEERPDVADRLDPELGWHYQPGFRSADDAINAAGMRSTHAYAERPPPGVLRVAAFGDSFVYGSEVGVADAWATLVEDDEDPRRIEVLDYGVPGYGVDQSYLRYRREGAAYAPDVVVIGFAPMDIERLVNVYRRFYHTGELPVFKPRFALDAGGGLTLVPSPAPARADFERLLASPEDVTRLAHDDFFYEPLIYANPLYDYSATVRLASSMGVRLRRRLSADRPRSSDLLNPRSTAFAIQCRLFEMFAAAVARNGARPLVLLLPDLRTARARGLGKPESYAALLPFLDEKKIAHVDGADAFREAEMAAVLEAPDAPPQAPFEAWFAPGGHYSAAGNRVIAAWLATELRRRYPAPARADPPGVPPAPPVVPAP